MSKVIIYTGQDGGVSVVFPAQGYLSIEEVAAKSVPQGVDFRITDESNIPSDRAFRNAWTDSNDTDTVDVDMPKARDIHMNNIRTERNKKLSLLDLDYIRADEQSSSSLKASIAGQKQALRDLTETFDLTGAETPEALKALWPTEI